MQTLCIFCLMVGFLVFFLFYCGGEISVSVSARSVFQEVAAGLGVFLDLRKGGSRLWPSERYVDMSSIF